MAGDKGAELPDLPDVTNLPYAGEKLKGHKPTESEVKNFTDDSEAFMGGNYEQSQTLKDALLKADESVRSREATLRAQETQTSSKGFKVDTGHMVDALKNIHARRAKVDAEASVSPVESQTTKAEE